MADFLSSLFGGGQPDTGASSGPFDSGFGNRLDALFMAMASTPPGGAGGIPLLQATQVANQQNQLAAQRNAMTQALVMYGVDPKVAATAAYNPDAGKMIMQLQQQKNGMSLINGALKNAPTMGGDAPAAAPAPQMPQLPTSTPMPSLPNVSMAPTANTNPSDASAPVPASGLIGPDATATPTLSAPAPTTMPGSVAPVPLAQPQSQRDAALMTYAQNKAPSPPQTQSSTALQSYYKKVHDYWTPYLTYEGMPGMGGVAAIAKEHLSLADKYLGPDANPALQGEIAAAREGGKYAGPEANVTLQANLAGAKKAATFPYDAATEAMRYALRPITVSPGQTVTTGGQVNPIAGQILGNVAKQFGGANGSPQAANGSPTDPLVQQYTPHLVPNPDGSFGSSVTPAQSAMQHNIAEGLKAAQTQANAANKTQFSLNLIERDMQELNKEPGWYNTGTGAEWRNNFAKTVNSYATAAGMAAPFDENKVASSQSLVKESTRLGFALSRTLGAREAMQIVNQAIAANPGMQNTEKGAAMVLNSLRMSAQSDKDYYNFLTQYMDQHGGQLIGADKEFYKQNPPSAYSSATLAAANAPNHVQALLASAGDPKYITDFNAKYGNGAAQVILRAYNVQ